MTTEWISSKTEKVSGSGATNSPKKRAVTKKTKIEADHFLERLLEVREEINEGLGSSAEESILNILETHDLTKDQHARIAVLHSRSLEIRGKNKEALFVTEHFINENSLDEISIDSKIEILIQKASSQAELNMVEESILTIENAFEVLRESGDDLLLANAMLVRARIYRAAGEQEIAIQDAETALSTFRDSADWLGMAWSYQELGHASLNEGQFYRAQSYFDLALRIIGENNSPVILARVFADLGTTKWMLNDAKAGVEDILRAVEFYNLTENRFRLIFAYNDLGVALMQLGDFIRAESSINESLLIAKEFNHSHIAGIYDSLGEFHLLRHDFDAAEQAFEKAIKEADARFTPWYKLSVFRNLARLELAKRDYRQAEEQVKRARKLAEELGDDLIGVNLDLLNAEIAICDSEPETATEILSRIDTKAEHADFYILGTVQKLYGEAERLRGNLPEAIHFYRKSLTIFETRNDAFNRAHLLDLIGDAFLKSNHKEAERHFISASEIFRKLGIKRAYNKIEYKLKELHDPKKAKAAKKLGNLEPIESVRTQLLMQRLAEATASRELVFRELVAILRQESKASKIIIAESDAEEGWKPFITHDFTPAESNSMVWKLQEAIANDMLDRFAKDNNGQIFMLSPLNAEPAVLLIFPKSSAVLNNGGKLEPLLKIVELGLDVCALRFRDRDERIEEERNPYVAQSIMPGFIHSSPAMTKLVEEVYRIRNSDVNVLITGESGTGKELVARAVHSVSTRRDNVFVPFNCTAVPKELTEGHLFGYKRGAFTGAANDSPGMIKTADGGTLLLDEIGDLPIDVQPKLLRFLQEGEIQPLGERRPMQVDVRVVAATNMDLEDRVKAGLFREDLFYRLNVIRLKVPPLRERKSEIKPMVMYYINHYSQRFNKKNITIKSQAIDLLMVSDWEGNVRQLCNEMQRIIARAEDGDVITPDHISPELKKMPVQTTFDESGNVTPLMSNAGTPGAFTIGMEGTTIEEAVGELESQMILDSMRRNDGNITRVSKELGLTRRGLYMKIDRYGIKRAS